MSADAATLPAPAAPERTEAPAPPRHRYHSLLWLALAVMLLIVALLVGWLPHHKRNKQLNANAQQQKDAVPVAEVQTVHLASSIEELVLPGTVTPLRTAHVYAQAVGYLKTRYVDLGDTVRKGQILGVISAPELDASVAQAAAAVQQSRDGVLTAQSTLHLQEVTYARVHTLVSHGILSQQEDDTARAAVEAAQANMLAAGNAVRGAQAGFVRAQATAGFEQIRAPIAGTITARNVEVGSLISGAGSAQGATPSSNPASIGGPPTGGAQGGELFDVTDLRSLEVFVSVPEQDAPFVQVGQGVEVTFSELPGETFKGTVARSSDVLSQQSRTLLAEVHVQDSQHHLKPGMFASTQMKYKAKDPGILIPGDSLITMAQGQFVPVVENNIIQMRPVHVGRDLGTQIYIVAGLRNGDNVVVNPGETVKQGARVNARPAPAGQTGEQAKPAGGAKGGTSGGKSKDAGSE